MSRLFPLYVKCLIAVETSLLALALLVLLNLLLHFGNFGENLWRLPIAAFLSSIPVVFLAEEKNVWKNEFLRCPLWLRIGCAISMIYGIAAASLTVVFSSQPPLFEKDPVFASAMPFFIVPMSIVVLVSVLRTGLLSDRGALVRYRISVAVAVLLMMGVAVHWVRSTH